MSVTATETRDVRPALGYLAVPAMLAIGALIAAQSEINGRLAGALGDGPRAGMVAALISFGTGLLLLTALVLLEPRTRHGVVSIAAAARTGRLRWWQLIGGVGGAFVVASQGLTVGTIGVALFTVAVVAGQTTSSLWVDQLGLSPAGHRRLTGTRVMGAAVTVVAVGLALAGRVGGADALASAALALALLPLAAGCGAAFQQAINGQVNQVAGPWATTWNNFLVGTSLLLVLAAGSLMLPGELQAPPRTWWLYTGGLMGIAFISAAAVLVRVHGVLMLGLCTVAGQVLGALAIDAVAGQGHIGLLSICGGGLTLIGVAVAASSGRRHHKDDRASRYE
jgi:transporter family-2 protein